MGILEAIILGLIQGLTEFLPVSSSGHIFLGQVAMGGVIEEPLLFTIVVHLATAMSTIVVFRKDIGRIFSGLFKFKNNEETRYSLFIIISMIPAAIVGFTLEDTFDSITKPGNEFWGLIIVGGCLLFTGLLLFFTHKAKKQHKKVDAISAFIIGLSQAIALLPGVSRSGSTIATGLLLGIKRENIARFSFLMVLPLIFGAVAKKALDYMKEPEAFEILPLVIGFIAAFLSGLIACKWMIGMVKKAKLSYFAIYCAVIGTAAITYSFFI